MSQSEVFHETWAYLRDNAKPVVPDDVYDLMVVRADMPPSKAHIKRIMVKSKRPMVNVVRPPAEPDRSARAAKNEAIAYGMTIRRMLQPNKMAKASPVPRAPLAPIPPSSQPVLARTETDKATSLRRSHMIALAKMAKRKHDFDVAEVLEIFGSADSFFRAINS